MRSMGNILRAPIELHTLDRDNQPPAALASITLEAWTEANRDRIWNLMRTSDRRDVTFDDFAAALWRTL